MGFIITEICTMIVQKNISLKIEIYKGRMMQWNED